ENQRPDPPYRPRSARRRCRHRARRLRRRQRGGHVRSVVLRQQLAVAQRERVGCGRRQGQEGRRRGRRQRWHPARRDGGRARRQRGHPQGPGARRHPADEGHLPGLLRDLHPPGLPGRDDHGRPDPLPLPRERVLRRGRLRHPGAGRRPAGVRRGERRGRPGRAGL
ncbi:MAG: Rieske (2Fe-2S) domain protein, partial [uncultured Nocardioidaceae bacterium]